MFPFEELREHRTRQSYKIKKYVRGKQAGELFDELATLTVFELGNQLLSDGPDRRFITCDCTGLEIGLEHLPIRHMFGRINFQGIQAPVDAHYRPKDRKSVV